VERGIRVPRRRHRRGRGLRASAVGRARAGTLDGGECPNGAIADPDPDPDPDPEPDGHAEPDADTTTDRDADRAAHGAPDADPNCAADPHPDGDTDTDARAHDDAGADEEAAPHAETLTSTLPLRGRRCVQRPCAAATATMREGVPACRPPSHDCFNEFPCPD
jgi:hypothetical protein